MQKLSEKMYPKEYELIPIHIEEEEMHSRYVRSQLSRLMRERMPLTKWEQRNMPFPRELDPRDEWNVYYSNSLKTIVYCIPFFRRRRSWQYENPTSWSKAPHGFVEGTKFWTNGSFFYKGKKFAHEKDRVIPLTGAIQLLLSDDGGVREKADRIYLIDHPAVYAYSPVCEVLTPNKKAYFMSKYLDLFYSSSNMGTYPYLRWFTDRPNEAILEFRNPHLTDNKTGKPMIKWGLLYGIVLPLKLTEDEEIIIKALKRRRPLCVSSE